MTNTTDYSPLRRICNGETVDFEFSWKVLHVEDLVIMLENTETGETRQLEYERDFTAEIKKTGGSITTLQVYEDEYVLIISRRASRHQKKSFSTSAGFQASEVESAFDNVSICMQDMDYSIETFKEDFGSEIRQAVEDLEESTTNAIDTFREDISDQLNRALKVPPGSNKDPNELMENLLNAENTTHEYMLTAGVYAEEAKTAAEIATQKADEVDATYNTAMTDITNLHTTAVDNITTIKATAIEDVNTAKTNASNTINSLRDTTIQEVRNECVVAVGNVQDVTNAAQEEIQSAYTTSMDSMSNKGNEIISDIDENEKSAIEAIHDAETAAIGNILGETSYVIIRDWKE